MKKILLGLPYGFMFRPTSQPNYAAMLADDTLVPNDSIDNSPQTNLVDLLEERNTSWKAYQEDYPSTFLDPRLDNRNFMKETLVVVTFDESENKKNNPTDTPIYTVLLGNVVKRGRVDSTHYNHYSLLRTIEDNFDLGALNRNDATANPVALCNFNGGCTH